MTSLNEGIDRDEAPLLLVIDDSEVIQELVTRALELSGYRVVSASTGRNGIAAAERYSPNAILLDIRLPDMPGYDVCTELKSRLATADIPVLFITGLEPSEEVISHCFKIGAHDLLSKPISQVNLQARVHVVLREQHLRDAYRRLATLDPHTGLLNRRQFFQYIQDAIATAHRNMTRTYLILCDISNLSKINEDYGYDFGDEIILTLARLMKRFTSSDCRVGRLAGDTFGIVMKNASRDMAMEVCERTSQTFSAIAFDADTSPKHFRIQVGIAEYEGEEAEYDHDSLMIDANIALCSAKRTSHRSICALWDLSHDTLPEISNEKRQARLKARSRSSHAYVGVSPPADAAPDSAAIMMPVETPSQRVPPPSDLMQDRPGPDPTAGPDKETPDK